MKLLSLSIQPLFVFDGPYRPSFKRGVKRAPFTASVDNFLTKQLLKLFGFPSHDAPGEAEAECALLQKTGIVDAVMSEDVDTIMFGSSLSLRNWTSEGGRGNKSPTHVDVYRSAKTMEKSGLDSDGMILVALMSGGDYIQAGIPKCGIKTACQAARAGFGRELCELPKGDEVALSAWRDRLQHEIRTNEVGQATFPSIAPRYPVENCITSTLARVFISCDILECLNSQKTPLANLQTERILFAEKKILRSPRQLSRQESLPLLHSSNSFPCRKVEKTL